MPSQQQDKSEDKVERVKVTAFITWEAYDGIMGIQRGYKRETGKSLPLWAIIDRAVKLFVKFYPNGRE